MDYRSGLLDQLDPTKKKIEDDPFAPPSPITGAGGTATNTGMGGGLDLGALSGTGGIAGSAPAAPSAPPMMGPAAGSAHTNLLEGDTGKLADLEHAKKSPKYDFLQLAQQNKYGYNQLPEMLKELQSGPNAKHWQGWTANKGDLEYKGDPSQLGQEWGGKTSVDAVGGFGQDGSTASGWRWGIDDAGTGAPGGPGGQGMFAGSSISPILQGDAQGNIQSALSKLSAPSDLLQQLLAQLQGGGQ
jgi:hypothetical protein